jgi:hypothetical protein
MPIQLSGSLVITGSITTTGVIIMSGSIASASYSSTSDLLQGTGSIGFTTTASFNAVSSSQQQISSSYIALSGSYTTFSGSASTRVTQIENVYATTGSNSFRATQSITGSLTVTGQIIAQTINVQQVTSSIIYSSGSNVFGCDLNSRQTFTGSVNITGSQTIYGNVLINYPSSTTTGNAFARLGASNTNATQQDYNISELYVSAGNGTVYGGLVASYSSTYPTSTPSVMLRNAGDGPLYFSTNGSIKQTITSAGVVGIGINAPVADDGNLVVAGCVGTGQGAANTVAQINIWETTSANKAGLWFGALTNANTGVIGSRTATGNIAFQTYCGGWAERMRIAYNGNVGIGTASPEAITTYRTLQVTGGGASTGGIFTTTTSDGSLKGRFLTSGGEISIGAVTNSPLVMFTNDTERMRITSDGYVGIGTSSPNISGGLSGNAILTMKATTNSRVAILELNGCRDSNGDNSSYIMAFNNSCTTPFGMVRFNRGTVDGCGSITLNTSGVDRMVVTSAGNVGIGTTDPGQKLEVVGGEIKAGRVDSSNEGGQLSFGRASDNATGWYIDAYGNTSTPSLRFVDVSNSSVRMTVDGLGIASFACQVLAPNIVLGGTATSFQGPIATYGTGVGVSDPYTADLQLVVCHSGWGGNYDSGTLYVQYSARAYGSSQLTTSYGTVTYQMSSNGVEIYNTSLAGLTSSNVSVSSNVAQNCVLKVTFAVAQNVDRLSIFARTTNQSVFAITSNLV